MRAPLNGVNVVGEGKDGFVERIGILHRNLNDDILDNVIEDETTNSGGIEMAVNAEYWQERLYKFTDHYDTDSKFFENAQKGGFLEGKMSAREMTFAKGGGLPTLMPLPANMNVSPIPGQ